MHKIQLDFSYLTNEYGYENALKWSPHHSSYYYAPPPMVIPGYVPVAVRYDSDIDRALHLLCKDMESIDCKVNNVKSLTNVFIF